MKLLAPMTNFRNIPSILHLVKTQKIIELFIFTDKKGSSNNRWMVGLFWSLNGSIK